MRRRPVTLGDALKDAFAELKQKLAPTSGNEAPPAAVRNDKQKLRPIKPTEPAGTKPKWARPTVRQSKSAMRNLRKQAANGIKRRDLDLAVYSGPPPAQTPVRVHRALLGELSADMRRLRIHAARSEASINPSAKPVVSGGQGEAILGLDFGTAFTKAVIRFDQRHYVVDWSGVVTTSDPCLMPSSFSEHEDGSVVLGVRLGREWSVHDGIKMQLLMEGRVDDDTQCDAVLFIAAAFRHACGWLPTMCGAQAHDLRWRLHLGLPTESWDAGAMASLFLNLAAAAKSLACEASSLTRERARHALRVARTTQDKMVAVLPEFACQLYSYLDSAQRQSDLHAMVDVGAGTVDVAFFNVHEEDSADVLPVFSATVRKLGTHYLIGALAGRDGEKIEWHDNDAASSDTEVAKRLGENPANVGARRIAYLSALARTFNEAREQARLAYPTSRALCDGKSPLNLFVCGGGGRLPTIDQHVRRWIRESKETLGMTIRLNPLPRPQALVGGPSDDQYDRISVAYGLSQLPRNVGKLIRRRELETIDASTAPQVEDRDATR